MIRSRVTRGLAATGGAIVLAFAFTLAVPTTSCTNDSGDVPAFTCAAFPTVTDAGVPSADFVPTLDAARRIPQAPVCLDDPAAAFPVPAADTVSLIACDDSYYAFYRGTDAGVITVDYYNGARNSFVARMVYTSSMADGTCTLGPSPFTPPACNGTQATCCGSTPDAGDGGDASSDAGTGIGIGIDGAAAANEAGCGAF